MLSSLSSGVTGLENFQQDMNVIGNNIANVNTTGFKAGVVDFADAFSNTLQGAGTSTPAVQVGTGVEISGISNNWTDGALSNTGINSNLAISGNGFFLVKDETTGAVYATRDGTFSVNNSGQLVTNQGYVVQGITGTTTGDITIGTNSPTLSVVSYSIDSSGNINVKQSDGTTYAAGQVYLQSFNDPQMLTNEGNNLYSNLAAGGEVAPTTGAPPDTLGMGKINSGYLESSNVDLSTEMANLITAQRAFEANSKIITTTNEVLQTLVNLKQS
jgi:flagellar hook protein FlgE